MAAFYGALGLLDGPYNLLMCLHGLDTPAMNYEGWLQNRHAVVGCDWQGLTTSVSESGSL